MGRLEAALREDYLAEGMEKGIARGEAKTQLDNIQKLIAKGLTLDKALNLLEIDMTTYEKYQKLMSDF